ncbi:OmpA family protein [Cellulomonas chengniuliangii]|uniref:OmpA family protein n=1 Tax=Cellulomonas chengniuliangii TaxID=2968084 RepID=UPI001D0E4050|nr:OmpA family protein [Cellulomonas chengniuliangii]MCC2318685.1 OmpA family protein [Cellulomonas chengniuliangii]
MHHRERPAVGLPALITSARARAAVAGVAVALGCVACAPGEDTAPTPTQTATEAAAEAVASPVVRSVTIDGAKVELAVGPLAVHGDVAVLRLSAPTEPPGLRMAFWEVFEGIGTAGPNGARLVDVDAGAVMTTLRDSADLPVMTRNGSPGGSATEAAEQAAGDSVEVVYAAFTVPDRDTVGVLLPQAGWFEGVPVVEAAEAGAMTVPPAELTDNEITDHAAFPLETYTEQVDGLVRARQTPTEVTVEIASDVLFAVDSADLGADAQAALAAAAAQVGAHSGGQLAIVGHTDDVADEAHNLDLSQRRAASVSQQLSTLVDLSGFDVTVEGRGESEPAMAGTSAEARSLNRRVTITLVPAEEAAPAPAAPDDPAALPEATGPSAAGPDGVAVQDGANTYAVRLPQVRRVGPYLVGELELTNQGAKDLTDGVLASGVSDTRGRFDPSLQLAATNVSLLVGGSRVFPVDYVRPEADMREPLSDRVVTVDAGATRVVTVVWPDTGTTSVAVEVAPRQISAFGGVTVGGAAFRLTDIPVLDGE